jgi:hypothetical protein
VYDVDVVRQLAQVAEYPLAALVFAHVVFYTELRGLWRADHFLVEQISFSFAVQYVLRTISVADPGSGAFSSLNPGSGMGKKQDLDPG